MKTNKIQIATAIFMLMPLIAMAHPGHNHEPGFWNTVQHLALTFAPFVGVLVLVAGGFLFFRNRKNLQKIKVKS